MSLRRIAPMKYAIIAVLAAALLAPATLIAQSTSYSRAETTSGAQVQLNFHATAKKNCTAMPLPTIRVLEVPRFGTLTVRRGEATIASIANCQPFKTPAEVVIYQSRPAYIGQDHLIYEVTSANGEVANFDISIEVKEGLPPRRPENPT
jgi:hypothetical protein